MLLYISTPLNKLKLFLIIILSKAFLLLISQGQHILSHYIIFARVGQTHIKTWLNINIICKWKVKLEHAVEQPGTENK